jgi:hypothetical protein
MHSSSQGESSTGTHQALGSGLGEACKAAGTLLVVDTVAALGGVPCFADAWGIDAIYSGSQKCLSAPPGAAPLFFSQRAVDKLRNRKSKPATYNLDMNLIGMLSLLGLLALTELSLSNRAVATIVHAVSLFTWSPLQGALIFSCVHSQIEQQHVTTL